MKAVLIKEDGNTQPIEPNNGLSFELEELQGLVGGTIEIIYLTKDTILVLNEEGKINGKCLPNPAATAFFQMAFDTEDEIYGEVVMCDNSLVK